MFKSSVVLPILKATDSLHHWNNDMALVVYYLTQVEIL